MLDRGLYNLIDPNSKECTAPGLEELDKQYLYIVTGASGVKIEEVLPYIRFSRLNSLKGVILYTYDDPTRTSEHSIEPAEIASDLSEIIGKGLSPEYIHVIGTNSEIYHLAGINLYINDSSLYVGFTATGKRSDFMLYGLFMGEILYHRIVGMINKQLRLGSVN